MKEMVSILKLIEAYDDCCKTKKGSVDYQHFCINAEYELYKLYKELNNGTYKPSNSVAFLVHHPKDREVFAANFRDRIVQHLLIAEIRENFELEIIDDSYSCRVGKGTLYGINRCYEQIVECSNNFTVKTYIGKFDVKSFFTSIDKNKLWDCLDRFLIKYFSENEEHLAFLKWLTKLIVYDDPKNNCIIKGDFREWKCLPKSKSLFFCGDNKGLPIGNLTSQIFANLFMDLLDKFIKEKLLVKYYGRYVDDFFIVSRSVSEIIEFMRLIKEFLLTMGLELHPNKIYIQEVNKGLEFLGTIIKPNRKYVKGSTKSNFYKKLKFFDKYLEENENIDIYDLRYIQSVINSFIGYFMKCNSFNLRKKMLSKENIPNIYKYFVVNLNYNKIVLEKDYCYLLRNASRIKERYQVNKLCA